MNIATYKAGPVESLFLQIGQAKDEFTLTHLALQINTTTKDPDEQQALTDAAGRKYAEFNAIAIAAKGGFTPRWGNNSMADQWGNL